MKMIEHKFDYLIQLFEDTKIKYKDITHENNVFVVVLNDKLTDTQLKKIQDNTSYYYKHETFNLMHLVYFKF